MFMDKLEENEELYQTINRPKLPIFSFLRLYGKFSKVGTSHSVWRYPASENRGGIFIKVFFSF